jgi:Tol biopolymer transport system component
MKIFVLMAVLVGSVAACAESAPLPEAILFSPGVISGPANDGSPTFSPDGNTLLFTRSAPHWTVILESHLVKGQWSKPVIASFSGHWPDSSPAWSPDGMYVVFQSTRPKEPLKTTPEPGKSIPGIVSNLWRVERKANGWAEPERLPDEVNATSSIWKPSIAANGDIYLTVIGPNGQKAIYVSSFRDGRYQKATPLPFSDGSKLDVDPEIAPDGSFLVFSSAARVEGDSHERLFLVKRNGDLWGVPTLIRYKDDVTAYGASTDNEPHLGRDGQTIYFTSDRTMVTHFPRTSEQAARDLERLDIWDNSNSNVWSISLRTLL